MARTRSRHRLSDAERAKRRDAHRRQLTDAVQALLSSEGWARWVRARARNGLARYTWFLLGETCQRRAGGCMSRR
jgi:hypothetical protein